MKTDLKDYLKTKTDVSELGNESLIISNKIYGREIGNAINEDRLLEFSLELSDYLPEMDIYKACVVSNFIGFACEKLNDTSAGKCVIEYFAGILSHVKRFCSYFQNPDGEIEFPQQIDTMELYKKDVKATQAYFGFHTLCVAVMAFLSRDYKCRQFLRQLNIEEAISFLVDEVPTTEQTKTIFYINRVKDSCGSLPLLILDMEKRQGMYAEANDLNNCFHLLFLLEEMISHHFKDEYRMEHYTVDEVLLSLAKGKYPDYSGKHCETFFTEYNYGEYIWEQMNSGNEKKNLNEKLSYLIWGEMPPENIPSLEGYHIILLHRNELNRGFSPDFLFVDHTALKPYVKFIRSLNEKEFCEWENRLKERG